MLSPQQAKGFPLGRCLIRSSSSGVRKDVRPAANPTARESNEIGIAYRSEDDDVDDDECSLDDDDAALAATTDGDEERHL
mmetsp:Transcript_2251/g.4815  ORF Transcript_2251/g.4815 Transcript_2251/m.4815 type:complete len:80 (+) Transcript_2251:1954-2193(+)